MGKLSKTDIETVRKAMQIPYNICSEHTTGCSGCYFYSTDSSACGCIFEYPPEKWSNLFNKQFGEQSDDTEIDFDAEDVHITKQGRKVKAYFICPRCECEFNCDIRKCVDIAAEPHHECPNCGYFVKSDCVK